MAKKFTSASAFKTSLEARLRTRALEVSIPYQSLRTKFVIERFLARLFREDGVPWFLKGGFAMDLRFRPRARTTKDVDLSVRLSANSTPEKLHDLLRTAAAQDLGDFLNFRIGAMKSELTQAPGGGGRFPCEAYMLGKVYARFQVDIGIGDPVIGDPERLIGDDILDFAGIETPVILAIPRAQQFSEKVHAYTYPWNDRLNTRSKDLVDLVLLIERGHPIVEDLRSSLVATFAARQSHPLPMKLPKPPEFWAKDFPGMAAEAGLSTQDLYGAFEVLERFWVENGLGNVPSA